MKAILLSLIVVFSGCQIPGAPDAPRSTGVLVAVGAGGMIARMEVAVANPNLPASKILNGNYIFGGNVRVLGSFNQGKQQADINAQAASGQIANAAGNSVAFSGDMYVKGTLYQQLGQLWTALIANNFAGNNIFCIGYGSGVFLAGGAAASLSRSTDNGATWSALIANGFNGVSGIRGVAFGSGVFVIVAELGQTSYSTDLGVTIHALVANPFGGTDIRAVAYGNGIFVAVGAGGKIARSTDLGKTWGSLITNPFGVSVIRTVTFANGVFVATSDSGVIARSADLGLTWGSAISNPFGGTSISGLSFGNGALVAGGAGGKIAYSIDLGLTWSALISNPLPGGSQVSNISYNFGIFQVSTFTAETARSYDNGQTWGSLIVNPFGANSIYAMASSDVNITMVGGASSIATAGWNSAYSLVQPVSAEPSLGTDHVTSDANRTTTLVVNIAGGNTGGTWSAAVTMTGVPVGAKAAWCMANVNKAGTLPSLAVEAATGYTLSNITVGNNLYKYIFVTSQTAGNSAWALLKIHLDSNLQFKWCASVSNSNVQITSAIDYEM